MKNKILLLLVLALFQTSVLDAEARKEKKIKTPVESKQKNKMDKLKSYSYHQSGGFAAVNRGFSVSFADLSKEDQEKLGKLISESGLLKLKDEKKTTKGAADMFFYEFVANDGKEHKAVFDDGQLPEAFRPLVEFSQEHAKTAPRS